MIVPERSLAKGICTSLLWQWSCSIGVGNGWTVAVGLGSVPHPPDSFVLKTLWLVSGLGWTCTVVCITVGEVEVGEGRPQTGGVGSNW